ncbi:hypothetical protein [Curtobacterium luteum]|uniref:hypothetical protein n=1 Tax=Curtobacterium luteum TaxID=33881 RepID=UPI0037F57AC7
MSAADDGLEGVVRRIVREELERAFRSPAATRTLDDGRMLYDVAGLAEAVGMSRQYIRNDIASGRLTATKSGRSKFVIDRSEAIRYAAWLASGRP